MLTCSARTTYVPQVGIAEALEAFRRTVSEPERSRLVTAIRSRLMRAVRYANVPELELEDVVQGASMKVLEALTTGTVPGSPEAYVWRAGMNAARDWHRRQSAAMPGRTTTVDPDDLERLGSTQEQADEEETLAQEMTLLLEMLRDPEMPGRHREILEAHYLRHESIEALAEQELRARPRAKSGEPRSSKQARDAVDKRLERARDQLRLLVHRRKARGR